MRLACHFELNQLQGLKYYTSLKFNFRIDHNTLKGTINFITDKNNAAINGQILDFNFPQIQVFVHINGYKFADTLSLSPIDRSYLL